MVEAEQFYDALAPSYHLLFDDWTVASTWHGDVIGRLLADRGVVAPMPVLDVTCGIGTQALPLAVLGYRITGTDISARAVARAQAEAAAQALDVSLAVADVRAVRQHVTGNFAAVVSCDNALPHLLTDEDLHLALHNVRSCLVPGGPFVASIRDYDGLRAARPAGVPVAVSGDPGQRHASGQSWRWSEDGDQLTITLFTITEDDLGTWSGTSHETTYRALTRRVLTSALQRAGFLDCVWLRPEESGYYQPVVVAV